MSDEHEQTDTQAAENGHHHPNYTVIWVILLVLMLVQFGVKKLDVLNYTLFIGFIFTVATVKTLLVALNFMHMKFENIVIYLMALSPVLFVVLFFSVVVFDVPVLS